MGKRAKSPERQSHEEPTDLLMGKMIRFGEGQRGRIEAGSKGAYVVKLAIPDRDGLLIVTDSRMVVGDEVEEIKGAEVSRECKARAFEHFVPFTPDEKALTVKDDNDVILDYQNVVISGLASTFESVTAADRDGDYVVDTAFDKTLQDFNRNPVMLTDHRNAVAALAGSFTKVGKVTQGLAVEGRISNAPDVKSIRFKVMEGHLKAFSIGGMFLYGADGRAIEEVALYEVSLVPVPANQDALFFTRSLNLDDCAKFSKHIRNLRTK